MIDQNNDEIKPIGLNSQTIRALFGVSVLRFWIISACIMQLIVIDIWLIMLLPEAWDWKLSFHLLIVCISAVLGLISQYNGKYIKRVTVLNWFGAFIWTGVVIVFAGLIDPSSAESIAGKYIVMSLGIAIPCIANGILVPFFYIRCRKK